VDEGPLRVLQNGAPSATVALIGQPNCGKSTLFNCVAGYRAETSNYSGTTVQLVHSRVRLNGSVIELVDVPGIYSLTTSSPAEAAARSFLLSQRASFIINVIDAALLSRSLELTLELRELGIPMVVCLNMADEATAKGIAIDEQALSQSLGVPVVKAIASRGDGVRELFAASHDALHTCPVPLETLRWSRDVEQVISALVQHVNGDAQDGMPSLPARLVAIKLLENDEYIAATSTPQLRDATTAAQRLIEDQRGRPSASVIMSERHDVAMRLAEQVCTLHSPRRRFRTHLDDLLAHPLWGYVFLLAVMTGFFWSVFGIGASVERMLQRGLASTYLRIAATLTPGSIAEAAVRSLWDGFVGGASVVMPYLVPFFIGLAILEDIGYLPRIAYLLDGLLHRVGLHGSSMLPLVLGYGCSVPACLATRVLPSRRDRFIASVLATLVPCSARSNVIFALVAFYLGPGYAIAVFALNAAVVIFSGWFLSRLMPEVSPGMVLDVPRYQVPRAGTVLKKVWLRMREFVVLSWPLLIVGSLVLGLADHWHWNHAVNSALSPLTRLLGLPLATGTTLVFGLLRKELSMIMLGQALGTNDIGSVMTHTQILVFTLFVAFYVPCLATVTSLVKEIGRRMTLWVVTYTLAVATILALLARLTGQLLFAR
jgi:ferrous iron transport protein B